jgi:hypothetical protein
MNEHKVPWAMCRICDYLVDMAGHTEDGNAAPKPDDVTLCIKCGAISVFDENLGLRSPTLEEYDQALTQRETQAYLMSIWVMARIEGKED